MIASAIPVIAVSDSARAEDYYCRVLGFQKMFTYPPDATKADPQMTATLTMHLQRNPIRNQYSGSTLRNLDAYPSNPRFKLFSDLCAFAASRLCVKTLRFPNKTSCQ